MKIPCGGTCQKDNMRTCSHGHGVVVQAASSAYPADWLQTHGRGCCPHCEKGPVGCAYLPGVAPAAPKGQGQ